MPTFSGADVEQLRALAQRFETQSERMREVATSSSVAILTAEWSGAEVEGLRARWSKTSKPLILQVAGELARAAADLRHRATQQERISAASRAQLPTVGSREEGSPHTAPPTSDLIRTIGALTSEDLYRIDTVVGEDGTRRHVVYIDGTHGDIGDFAHYLQTHGWLANLPASFGLMTEARRQVEDAIAERVGDSGEEVMIVGHSQGGMLAQAIADSERFNVREVLTVGSPPVAALNGYGSANVTRLAHNSDVVVGGTAVARLYAAGLSLPAAVIAGLTTIDTPLNGEINTFSRGSSLEGAGAHDVRQEGDYAWLADRYDESTDPEFVAARQRQAAFTTGTVIETGTGRR